MNNNTNSMNKNIYRLIKPYQSMTVYEAKTTMHGAGKCNRELKKSNVNCDSFTIMNINDNSMYDFKMNPSKTPEMILKNNNTNQLLNNQNNQNNQMNQMNQMGGADIITFKTQIYCFKKEIDGFKKEIELLKNKISLLENKKN